MGKLKQDCTIRGQKTGAKATYNNAQDWKFRGDTATLKVKPVFKVYQGKTYSVSSTETYAVMSGELIKSVDIWEEVL